MLDELRQLAVASPRPFVIDLERSHGMYIATSDDRMLFDWAGYYGSKLLAHNHECYNEPEYVKHCLLAANNKVANPDFVTPYLVNYIKMLHEIAPKCIKNPALKVFTVNSGAEAVENGLKYLITRFRAKHRYHKPRFMTFEGGFHGRTLYSLGHTDMPHSRRTTSDYYDLIRRPIQAPFPVWDTDMPLMSNARQEDSAIEKIESMIESYKHELAGIIIEPMQGAGGHRVASDDFFRRLSVISANSEVPLMFDEVQTGGGPCGSFWMCDMFNLPHAPEVVVSAKKLACGVVYMRNDIAVDGLLDSTWSGHIVDMNRFCHEFKVIERDDLIERARTTGAFLRAELRCVQRDTGVIRNVRGEGLYLGFTVSSRELRDQIVKGLLEHEHTLVLGAGVDSIRVRPNMNVTEDDVVLFITKLRKVIADIK